MLASSTFGRNTIQRPGVSQLPPLGTDGISPHWFHNLEEALDATVQTLKVNTPLPPPCSLDEQQSRTGSSIPPLSARCPLNHCIRRHTNFWVFQCLEQLFHGRYRVLGRRTGKCRQIWLPACDDITRQASQLVRHPPKLAIGQVCLLNPSLRHGLHRQTSSLSARDPILP